MKVLRQFITSSRVQSFFRWALNLCVLGGAIWFFSERGAEFMALRPKGLDLGVSFGFGLLVMVFRGLFFQRLVLSFGGQSSFSRSLECVSVATLFNHILPYNLGMVYMIAQIQKSVQKGTLQASSVHSATFFYYLFCDSFLALMGLSLMSRLREVPWILLGAYFVVIIVLVVIFYFSRHAKFKNEWLSVPMKTLKVAFSKESRAALSFYAFGSALILAGVMGGLTNSLGHDLSWDSLVALTGIRNTSLYLAFTPGSIGVSEALIYSVGPSMGLDEVDSVYLGLGARIVMSLAAGCFLISFTIGRFFKKLIE